MADWQEDTRFGKKDAKNALIEKSRKDREERELRKWQESVIVRIQALVRGHLARIHIILETRKELLQKLSDIEKLESALKAAKKEFTLPPNASIRLTRCAWMLCRLSGLQSGKKSKGLLTLKDAGATKEMIKNVSRLVSGTIRSGKYDSIWDSGNAVRMKALVIAELSNEMSTLTPLLRSLLSSEKIKEWTLSLVLSIENLIKKRLNDARQLDDMTDLLVNCSIREGSPQQRQLHRLLLTSPGLFSRLANMQMYETLAKRWMIITQGIKADITSMSDDALLSCLGNVFSMLMRCPRSSLSLEAEEATFELILILLEKIPDNTFAGSEGVAWSAKLGGVAKVDPIVLQQLDFGNVFASRIIRTCIAVHPTAESRRVSSDLARWESLSSGVPAPKEWSAPVLTAAKEVPTSSTTTTATGSVNKRKSVFSIMSTSNWARKLGWSSDKESSSKNKKKNEEEEEEPLLLQNKSEESRRMADSKTVLFLRPKSLLLMLKCLAVFFYRWPPKSSNPRSFSALNSVAFASPAFLHRTWWYCHDIRQSSGKLTQKPSLDDNFVACSFSFGVVASHVLLVTDEMELYEQQKPLNRLQVEQCVQTLNEVLFEWLEMSVVLSAAAAESKKEIDASQPGTTTTIKQSPQHSLQSDLATSYETRLIRLLTQLRDMHTRRPLTRESAWLLSSSSSSASSSVSSLASTSLSFFTSLFTSTSKASEDVLTKPEKVCFSKNIFWASSFEKRAEYFSRVIAEERARQQPQDGPVTYRLEVRRHQNQIDERVIPFFLKSDLRKRIYVVFTNELGLVEAGIDSRGLMKEFIQSLAEMVFDPRRGLFAVSEDGDGALFPSPMARTFLGSKDECLRMFNFASRVLGKALFEGIVIQPEFSLFILAKLLNKLVTITELQSLDRELFKNLVFLKNTEMDVSDLGLTFSIESPHLNRRQVELYPGGSSVDVNNDNKFKYVNLVAHYRLNVECKEEHEAFVSGFRAVISPEWTAPFSERELQRLISGDSAKLDVKDWRANTVYGGGYISNSQVVNWFWDCVEHEMTDEERALLLRFATACTRAPLLGFAHLEPKFHIQRVSLDGMQLPTASTCFNTLKLPAYPSKQVLKQKLMQAIKSNSGFDLT